jgi:hypothetical protein
MNSSRNPVYVLALRTIPDLDNFSFGINQKYTGIAWSEHGLWNNDCECSKFLLKECNAMRTDYLILLSSSFPSI